MGNGCYSMTRTGIFLGVAIVSAALLSFAVYAMKYEVERLSERGKLLSNQISLQEQTLQVLSAEWSLLNQPNRIHELASRHLELELVPMHRIGTLDQIPFREAARPAKSRNPLDRLIRPLPLAHVVSDKIREGP